MSGTAGRAAPGAAVASLAALALVTAGLQAAVVAIDSGDAGAAIAASIGVWFQGLWAVFAWRRPGRDVLVAGLVANLALLAVSVARLATRSGPAQPSEVLVAVFELVLVGGLGWTLARPSPPSTAPATPRSAWLTGTLAAVLAVASLLATGPAFAPPGVASPIVGAAVVPTTSTAPVVSPSSAQPSPSASPTDPGLSQTASSTPGASPIPTSTPAAPGTVAPSPPSTPVAATAAAPTPETSTPAATPSSPSTATPRPTAATPAPKGNLSTPRPTPRPTAAPTPSPKPTPPPTPRPAPSATASKTPAPTPAPTAPPTPSPTQPPVEAAHPGTITFGSNYDPSTLAIIGPTTTIHRGELVAWRADLTEPAGSTTLTFTVTEPNPPGPEFPHWQQDFSVPDASYVVIVNRVDLSVYVHGEPGTFIMRIRRGQTVLAQGQFRLIP